MPSLGHTKSVSDALTRNAGGLSANGTVDTLTHRTIFATLASGVVVRDGLDGGVVERARHAHASKTPALDIGQATARIPKRNESSRNCDHRGARSWQPPADSQPLSDPQLYCVSGNSIQQGCASAANAGSPATAQVGLRHTPIGEREYEVEGPSACLASKPLSPAGDQCGEDSPGRASTAAPETSSRHTSLRALSCSTSMLQSFGAASSLAATAPASEERNQLSNPNRAPPLQPPPAPPKATSPPPSLPYGNVLKGTWEPLNIFTLACPDRLAEDRNAWSMADFEHSRKAGSGESSVVHVMREKLSRWQVVVKVCHRTAMQPGDDARIKREVRMHAALDHPHICPLYGAFETPAGDIVLILRYASLGNMADHVLQLNGAASEPYAVARLLLPVVDALGYLHARGVVHGDVKAENVVVDGETGNAMLIDFGHAVDTRSAAPPVSSIGTPPYTAPELLASASPASTAADVWALGILTYKVLAGSFPFAVTTTSSLLTAIESTNVRVPRYLSVVAASFIQQALTRSPAERPRISELRRHPWLVSRGSIVPVDLAAPAWGHLGVAPFDGTGELELLPCPQGIDQAQYDGLSRLRFKRSGFHAPDIALTGPLCLTPHCSFHRVHSPPSAVLAALATRSQESNTIESPLLVGSGEDESRLLPSSRSVSCVDAALGAADAFWGKSLRNPSLRGEPFSPTHPLSPPLVPCTPLTSRSTLRPQRSLLTMQLEQQASASSSASSNAVAGVDDGAARIAAAAAALAGAADAGHAAPPPAHGTEDTANDAAALLTWSKLYQRARDTTDSNAPVADVMRAATAYTNSTVITGGAPSATTSSTSNTLPGAPPRDKAPGRQRGSRQRSRRRSTH